MKNKLITILAVTLILSGCVGCQEKEADSTTEETKIISSETQEKKSEDTEHKVNQTNQVNKTEYSVKTENLELNIRYPKEWKEYLYCGEGTMQQINKTIAYERLFSDIDATKEVNEFYNGTEEYYSNDQGQYMTLRDTSLTLDREDIYFGSVMRLSEEMERNAQLYASPREFNFGKEELGWEKLTSVLHEIGLDLGEDYEKNVYYLDHQTTAAEYEKYKEADISGNIKEAFSQKDYYYYTARQNYQQVPVVFLNDISELEVSEDYWQINAAYSKDGLTVLTAGNFLKMTDGEKKKLLPFDEIIDSVAAKYSQIISTQDQYKIESVNLMMFAREYEKNQYHVNPVWVFEVMIKSTMVNEQGNEMLNEAKRKVLIDAVTGKEVVL